MKKAPALFVAALLSASTAIGTAHAAVILSELCDPHQDYSTNRFIEIYNSGPGGVDLTGWSVVAVANTTEEPVTWALSGTLPAGQARVCGYTAPTSGFTVDFQDAAWNANTSGQGSYNWNGGSGDGAKLKDNNGTVIDYVLVGSVLFSNSDMVRNSNITTPNPMFTQSEWTITPVEYATDASPGTHNGSTPQPGPVISDIITDPATPIEGAGTHVQASVVDTAGAIVSVTTAWGTSSGSLGNSITMELLSDSTYRTTSQIPAQGPGATIYYRVQAVGPLNSSSSDILSFSIPGDGSAPTVLAVGEASDSTLLVTFSEPVEETSAETPANYTVGALVAVDAVRDPVTTSQVLITVRDIPPGSRTLTVNGVADLSSNTEYGATRSFTYIDVSIPAGYYDGTAGLTGSALRVALHNIIKNHTVESYAYALTAFAITDVKPNGKIWDMYSDIPGGTPPYEYNVGQTGQGGSEGLGYNREHSFPQSWFGGLSPMYSDLWILYPTDSYVNGQRANYPYGNVASASYTSLNGSKLGSSATPGYSGTVFEPIDGYKGDLARGMFYIATRYFNEDAGWPGSPAVSGSQWLPWAANQYLAWSNGDPVSWKERLRNGAIYTIQHNRNPFVDHPEFVVAIYDSNAVAAVEPGRASSAIALRQNAPNPFTARTTLTFDLPSRAPVSLRIYDIAGRQVRVLLDGGVLEAGHHAMDWNGRDDGGALVEAGLYFCRLGVDGKSLTRRMVLTR